MQCIIYLLLILKFSRIWCEGIEVRTIGLDIMSFLCISFFFYFKLRVVFFLKLSIPLAGNMFLYCCKLCVDKSSARSRNNEFKSFLNVLMLLMVEFCY